MAKKFVFGAAIGGAIGALAALLFAPKKGSELRNDIKVKTDDLMEKSSDIREKGSQWVSIAVEKGTEIKDQVVAKSQDLKDKFIKSDSGDSCGCGANEIEEVEEENCDCENCDCENKDQVE